MSKKLLHSPEGVRDIYGEELLQKKDLEHALSDVIRSYGYDPVSTPSFEYFDVFAGGLTSVASRDLFKFFDREGNTLVLRPDITPSIARASAMYFAGDRKPLRLYYKGNVFVNNSRYQGRLAESTQMGAECIGDAGADADAEMIALSVDCLLRAGLNRFSISVGDVRIVQALIRACCFSEEEEENLRQLIYHHNASALEQFLSGRVEDSSLRQLFDLATGTFRDPAGWDTLRAVSGDYPEIAQVLDRLTTVYEILTMYGAAGYVTFEPGLGLSYDYYTGIVFAGYAWGSGQPVVTGGRYDHLLENFGRQDPAIGFALALDALLSAVRRQGVAPEGYDPVPEILCTADRRKDAVELAMSMRAEGRNVTLNVMTSAEEIDTRYPDGVPAHVRVLTADQEIGGLL